MSNGLILPGMVHEQPPAQTAVKVDVGNDGPNVILQVTTISVFPVAQAKQIYQVLGLAIHKAQAFGRAIQETMSQTRDYG